MSMDTSKFILTRYVSNLSFHFFLSFFLVLQVATFLTLQSKKTMEFGDVNEHQVERKVLPGLDEDETHADVMRVAALAVPELPLLVGATVALIVAALTSLAVPYYFGEVSSVVDRFFFFSFSRFFFLFFVCFNRFVSSPRLSGRSPTSTRRSAQRRSVTASCR
jgi:hypothetical protein